MEALFTWWHEMERTPEVPMIIIVCLFSTIIFTFFMHLRDKEGLIHDRPYLVWLRRKLFVDKPTGGVSQFYEVINLHPLTLAPLSVMYSAVGKHGKYEHYGDEIDGISFWQLYKGRVAGNPPTADELNLKEDHFYSIHESSDVQFHSGFVLYRHAEEPAPFHMCDLHGLPNIGEGWTTKELMQQYFISGDEGLSMEGILKGTEPEPDEEPLKVLAKDAVLEEGQVYGIEFANGSKWLYIYCRSRAAFLRLVSQNGKIRALNTRGVRSSTWRLAKNISIRKVPLTVYPPEALEEDSIYHIEGHDSPLICVRAAELKGVGKPTEMLYVLRTVTKRGSPTQHGTSWTVRSSNMPKSIIPMGTSEEYRNKNGRSMTYTDTSVGEYHG